MFRFIRWIISLFKKRTSIKKDVPLNFDIKPKKQRVLRTELRFPMGYQGGLKARKPKRKGQFK